MTISFSKWGALGRAGNQLFQLASMVGLSRSKGCDLALPVWQYAKYFAGPIPQGHCRGIQIKEPAFHYCGDFIPNDGKDYDVQGYLQSKRYFENCEPEIRKMLEWEPKFLASIKQKYADVFKKKTIAISCRIGDYRSNENYEVLPAMYYILALYEHFPDWKERNLLFISDDIEWCRTHFQCLLNAHFATDFENKDYWFDESAIEQMCVASLCDDFILANSTFSYWVAYLANRGKVVRPAHYMAGKLKQQCDMKDFWPSEWIEFDHKGRKFDLGDVTFTVPVSFDHKDRQKNLDLNICLLQRDFDCNIIIGEVNTNKFGYFRQWCDYRHFNLPCFHRTYVLNELAIQSKQDIIFNFDADISIAPMQLIVAVEKLRSGEVDFCYPYSGEFCRVDRYKWFTELERHLDVGIFAGKTFKGMMPGDALSVGGVVGYNKAIFFKTGGENEGYRSYGNEDVERKFRWELLGYKVGRVNGFVFHMDHHVGIDSTNKHSNGESNRAEWDKVSKMSKEKMLEYVKTWRCYVE